jgi:hypothetical protein
VFVDQAVLLGLLERIAVGQSEGETLGHGPTAQRLKDAKTLGSARILLIRVNQPTPGLKRKKKEECTTFESLASLFDYVVGSDHTNHVKVVWLRYCGFSFL